MSFTQILPPEMLQAQRQFMAATEAKLDFVWWAEALIAEETKELKQAHEQQEGMSQIFKEIGDVLYVVCGFYNTMPMWPNEIIPTETNENIQKIISDAWETFAFTSNYYKIPMNLMGEAFAAVHVSNLSKLGEDGKPIRREDGKILKGPNYQPPNMAPIVMKWDRLMQQTKEEKAN